MANQQRARMTVLLTFLAVTCLVVGWHFLQAQPTLNIRPIQILNINGNRVCQYVYEDGGYVLGWQSADLGGVPSVRLGDIDNDGSMEVVASVYYHRTEKVKRWIVTHYNFEILVFENGAEFDGGPSWRTGYIGPESTSMIINDSYIADVDGDSSPGYPDNELVLIRSTELDLFHFPAEAPYYDVEHLCTYPYYLFSLDVGDADNDGRNEIVVVPGNHSSLRIWKHLPDHTWQQNVADPIPPSLWGEGMSFAGVTYTWVRNADNIDGNEIIATGNNQRLMVWKWLDDGHYHLDSWSQDLNSNMAFGIDSGDIDGNGLNEVVISLWGLGTSKKVPPRVVTLAFEGNDWVLKNTFNSNYSDQRDLRLGDIDQDGRAEVVLNHNLEMKVLDFAGNLPNGAFQQVYSASVGAYYALKLEVR